MICQINSGPLLAWMEVGSPKRGMISVSRVCAAVEDLSFDVGKASIRPEKVSTRTRRYLCFFTGGM